MEEFPNVTYINLDEGFILLGDDIKAPIISYLDETGNETDNRYMAVACVIYYEPEQCYFGVDIYTDPITYH